MASLGSLSFLVETTMENSVLVGVRSKPYRKFSLVGFDRKDSFDSGLSGSNFVFLKLTDGVIATNCPLDGKKLVEGRNRVSRRHTKGLRATGRNNLKEENDDETDFALQETIEKSKKVLAMQNNLLEQIAERRKLISSIKNSIVNTEQDAVSYSKSSNTFSQVDVPSAETEVNQNFRNEILSEGYSRSNTFENSQAPIIGVTGGFDQEKQHRKSYPTEGVSSAEDSLKELKRTTQSASGYFDEEKEPKKSSSLGKFSSAEDSLELNRTTQSAVAPSLLPEKSKTVTSIDEEVEELLETNVGDASDLPGTASGEDDANPPPLAGANVMNVILVAAECVPWSKTGGLGDVASALPKALARRGHRVMVVVPRYNNYSAAKETGVRKRYKADGQDFEVTYFHAYIDGVDFVFLDADLFRHRENNIYGGNRLDILKCMVLLCKAAAEVPWHVPCGGVCYGDGNLVFIANDWHTALLPVYLKAYYRDNGLMKYTRSVLVIHNIAHQGRGPVEDFFHVDLPEHYMNLFRLYDPMGGDHFNIFAAGLKTADRVVTVSHGYAWEVKTSEGGWGLHEIINENNWKLRGIVNGIDPKEWNPKVDVHLTSDGYTNYSLETLRTGKSQCKTALQRELGLPVRSDVPLIGFIGRLDNQKGVDLIGEAIPWMVGQDVQLVMLGTGRPDLENMLRQFESQHHDKVRGWVGFSVKVAHRITAGADILLMPSRFEPCGLNQLYAMSYGTVPVVHAVGGLRDTVQPFDPFKESGHGWTFDGAESNKLIHALGNCLHTYRDYKNSWEGLQRRGMMQDLSWDNAAQQYEEVLLAAKYQW